MLQSKGAHLLPTIQHFFVVASKAIFFPENEIRVSLQKREVERCHQ